MSWELAFENNSIPWDKIKNLSTSKLTGKIDTSSLSWTINLSQLPEWIGWDATSLSWRILSTSLDNLDSKIPTNKAVWDKISWLLNCSASTIDSYSLTQTAINAEITKTKTVTMTWSIWTYIATQKFKCSSWSFEKVWSETYSSIACITDYYLSAWSNWGNIIPVCSHVGNWYYSIAWSNSKSACSSITNSSWFTSSWNGSASWCAFSCNSWYSVSWRSCLVSCSWASIWQSCYPSWSNSTTYIKYYNSRVMYNCTSQNYNWLINQTYQIYNRSETRTPGWDVSSWTNVNSGCPSSPPSWWTKTNIWNFTYPYDEFIIYEEYYLYLKTF